MDIEAIILAVVRELIKTHKFRLPMTIASVGANGSVLFTRMAPTPPGAPPGSVEQEHVTGEIDDEGFLAPIHMMVVDATGRAKLAIHRGVGDPVIVSQTED